MYEQLLIDILFYFLQMIVYPALWYLMLDHMLEPKYGWFVTVVIPSLLNTAAALLLRFLDIGAVMLLGQIVCIIVPAVLLHNGKTGRRVLAGIIVTLVTMGADILLGGIQFFLWGYLPTKDNPLTWLSVASLAVIIPVSALIYFSVAAVWRRLFRNINVSSIHLMILFPLGQYLFLIAAFRNYPDIYMIYSNPVMYIAVITAVASDIAMFHVLRREARLVETEKQMQLQLTYYSELSQKYDEIRKYRHDINNIIAAAEALIDNNTSKTNGEAVIREIKQRVENTPIPWYCANPIINAVLWQKTLEAQEKGIEMRVSVKNDDKFPLEKTELCSVFSNILDNAIRGASECENGTVDITVKCDSGMVFIISENSSDKLFSDTSDRPRTDKPDKTLHGQGIEILKSTANKYGGKFTVSSGQGRAKAVFAVLTAD